MGARQCKSCEHPERDAIDASLVAGVTLAELGRTYGMSKPALMRHRDNHLKHQTIVATAVSLAGVPVPGVPVAVVASAGKVVDRLARLADEAEVYALTRVRDGAPNAPAAMREARETLVRLGEYRGETMGDDPIAESKSMLSRLVDGLRGQRADRLAIELSRAHPGWPVERVLEEVDRQESAGVHSDGSFLHPHRYEPTCAEDYGPEPTG